MNGPTALGPVFTAGGFVVWDLLPGPEPLVAYRFSWSTTLLVQLVQSSGIPIEDICARERAARAELVPALESRHRVYWQSQLRRIVVQHRFAGDRVRLERSDGHIDTFGIFRQIPTERFRQVLSAAYPDHYAEVGL